MNNCAAPAVARNRASSASRLGRRGSAYPLMDQVYRLIVSLLISAATLAVGLYILGLDRKSTLNRLVFLACLCFIVRNTTAQFAYSHFTNRERLILIYKVNSFFNNAIFAVNLHFFLRLKTKKKIKAWTLALIYLPVLALSLVPIIDHEKYIRFLYSDGEWKLALPRRNARGWLHTYLWTTYLYLALTLILAFLCWKRSGSRREKRQALILLGGFAIYGIAQLSQVFLRKPLPPSLFVLPMLFYILGLCYATLRYRFLAPTPSLVAEDLIAHISDVVLLLDTDLRVINANPAAGDLFAAPPEMLEGRELFALARIGAETEKRLRDFMHGVEPSLRMRLAFGKEGGDPAMTETHLSKVRDGFSDLVGVLVVARELQGRKDFQREYRITERELEVVDLILSGLSNESVAEALGISERTVEAHCLHVYNKLGVNNRVELTKICAKYDLLP